MPSVLYVIDGREFGGGERVFLQLGKEIKKDFNVFLAAVPGGDFEKHLREAGLHFLPVSLDKRLFLRPVLQLRDIIRGHAIDIVHSQGARADFFSRIAGRIAGLDNILCTITMPVEGFNVGNLRKIMYRVLDSISGHYVRYFIVVSKSLERLLVENRKISDRRVKRIYNGIELDRYKPGGDRSALRDEWAVSDAEPVVGFFGRLVWQKGVKFLMEAVPIILSKFREVKFLIVGEGPERIYLENKAADLQVSDRIIFTGFVQDVRPLLAAVDVVAIPSLREGFPMITLEAMAMAKPIAATEIPGIDEQIDNLNEGILFPAANAAALAESVLKLLEDKPLAVRLGGNARSKVEALFSHEQMIANTRKLYQSLFSN